MSIKKQILAYLVDAAGKVYETLPIIAHDPNKDVEKMNATAKAANGGKVWWTLKNPNQSASANMELPV